MISLPKRALAEALGTLWLVFGGCGSAVLAAAFPNVGIGLLGVSLAFGLTVLTMAYAIGHVSGCHLNPAVSIGLWAGKRFPARELLPYIVAQVVGAIVGAGAALALLAGAGRRSAPGRILLLLDRVRCRSANRGRGGANRALRHARFQPASPPFA